MGVIKRILRILILVLALAIIYLGLRSGGIYMSGMNLPISSSITPPDWTEEKVMTLINDFRQGKGLGVLVPNDKLAKAAKARLAVILEYEDSLGDFTGLSREESLNAVDYEYSWVGDLLVVNFFRSNDAIAYWSANENSRLTLEEDNLKEVGIAIKQDSETVSVYVLLGSPAKLKAKVPTRQSVTPKSTWGGPQLWEAVNKRRVEMGVNPLKQRDELCTIAAIRLNQVLSLGSLDGHSGFEPTLKRDDLKWISEKYNISEFLISGYSTPQDSVFAWENTLGHKKLLSGGEYVWGCIYAQNQFGVAIAAY